MGKKIAAVKHVLIFDELIVLIEKNVPGCGMSCSQKCEFLMSKGSLLLFLRLLAMYVLTIPLNFFSLF
jgi:hypothetical protein